MKWFTTAEEWERMKREAQEPSLKENRVQNCRQEQCLVTGGGVQDVDHELV